MDTRHYDILCDILFFRWLVTLFLWGLPALLGPKELFDVLAVPVPENLVFLRLFGFIITALSLFYWSAWKEPLNRIPFIKFAILENGLATLTLWLLIFTIGLTGWFVWTSSLLTAFFFSAMVILLTRKERHAAVIHETTHF